MFTLEMVNRIDAFLKKKINVIFKFEFNGLLLLYGSCLKKFIMGESVLEYDFVLLTNDDDNILDFIEKYRLEYEIVSNNRYRFFYNGLLIYLTSSNDLSCLGEYNTDFIFYDVVRKQFIPIGIRQAMKKRRVVVCRCKEYIDKEKRKKIRKRVKEEKKFIQFMNNDNKKVKVVNKNKFLEQIVLGLSSNFGKSVKKSRR